MTTAGRNRLLFALLCLSLPAPAGGQQQKEEPGSRAAIARFTTDPRFVSPWVAALPDSSTVPSPTKYLGHVAGAAGELTHTAKLYGYLRALAASSKRVHLETIGKTEEGRDVLLLAISEEASIRDLDRLKGATAALADPRTTDPRQAQQVLATAKPFYYFNCSLHADEDGAAEMGMELAYRLAVSEDPMIQEIRKNVVVLINPVADPDGHDKMADWFYRYLKGKTDYAGLPRQSPPYWNRYVYVDINRDAHQLAFGVTQAVSRMFFAYHPVVIHDLHEGIPLLLTWNGTGPYNPYLDPLVTSKFLEMSFHEVTELTAMGMPGVSTWNFGEGFGLHFLDSIAMNHNAVGRGYETFGNGTAETVERVIRKGEESDQSAREWYRPSPAPLRFKWSMRDNVNYQQTAALSILSWTAKHARQMLEDFYRTGYNSWQKGVTSAPYAFIIPPIQEDRLRVAGMIERLLAQHIEVGRLTGDVTLREGRFAAGTYIVKLDQPYRNYAVDLLEPQRFPAESDVIPYDDISWALPVGFGVKVIRSEDRSVQRAPVELITAPQITGGVDGNGPVFLLRDSGQESLLAARVRLADFRVTIAAKTFAVGDQQYPAGSWIVEAQPGLRDVLDRLGKEFALDFTSAATVPDVARNEAPAPRIGVWVPWADTDAMGWVRYTLDREKVPYVYLRDEDLRAGNLRNKVDAIVYGPLVHLELDAQIHGIPSTSGPMAFKATAQFPNLGKPVESDDITGGPGYQGLENLNKFVEAGGLLLTLGKASALPLELGIVRGVRPAIKTKVFTPGSELRISFTHPNDPLAYGYGKETSVFRTNTPVYDAPRAWNQMAYCTSCLDGPFTEEMVAATWGGDGPMVVSGGMRGETDLKGRPAIFNAKVGNGRVIAYNFSPIHRDMNRSDHRLLWNALINWKLLTSAPAPAPAPKQ